MLGPEFEAFSVRQVMFADEIVVQRMGLLAEQMQLVAGAYQGAAEVLNVDVAPGAREHVAVGDQQLHAPEDSRVTYSDDRYNAGRILLKVSNKTCYLRDPEARYEQDRHGNDQAGTTGGYRMETLYTRPKEIDSVETG